MKWNPQFARYIYAVFAIFLVSFPILHHALSMQRTKFREQSHTFKSIRQSFLELKELTPTDDRIFLLSAFIDYKMIRYSALPAVSILGIVGNETKLHFRCALSMDEGHYVWTEAQLRLLGEGHYRPYVAAIIHCLLPLNFSDFHRVSGATVALVNNEHVPASAFLPVEKVPSLKGFDIAKKALSLEQWLIKMRENTKTIGFCIAPIRGDLYAESLRSFVRYHSTLANDDAVFYFYNHSAGHQTSIVLEHLKRSRVEVRVLGWKLSLPSFPGLFEELNKDIWYNGQVLAINDCLFRMIGKVRWVAFIDIDEYIVGNCRGALSFADIIRMTNPNMDDSIAAYIFQSAFYFSNCQNVTPTGEFPLHGNYFRGDFFGGLIRAKSIVDPLLVDIQHIHAPSFVSRVAADDNLTRNSVPFRYTFVPTSTANVHHYRHIPPEHRYKKNCSSEENKKYYTYDDSATRLPDISC